MNTNQIISTLGCIALILLAVYFVYGLLKVGGEGLKNLGNNSVIEGMSDERKEELNTKRAEKFDKILEAMKESIEKLTEQVNPDEYSDKIKELIHTTRSSTRLSIINAIASYPNSISSFIKQSAPNGTYGKLIAGMDKLEKILNYEGGGGGSDIGETAANATGGFSGGFF